MEGKYSIELFREDTYRVYIACRPTMAGHGWIDASTKSGCPAHSKLLQTGFASIGRALTIRRYGPRIMLACGLTSNAMTRLEIFSTRRHSGSRGCERCALFSAVLVGLCAGQACWGNAAKFAAAAPRSASAALRFAQSGSPHRSRSAATRRSSFAAA
jgi:hypothetical protein